ncbi:MAG: hypothetical protein KIT84_02105 [Labilithrix sp.]|nr:hypothetical protein [Labilithrix sp.]MCW5809782.1 hypothetical protein [Labilithrix sp.]
MMRPGWPTLLIGALLGIAPIAPGTAQASDENACSAAHVRAQVLKRDMPNRLLERRVALRTCSSDLCAPSIVDACSAWLREVEANVPSLTVRVVDQRGVGTDAAVLIDGRMQVPGLPLELDPGEHTIVVTGVGREESRSVLLRAGDKNHAMQIVLGSNSTAQASGAGLKRSERRRVPTGTWISYGIGAVGLGSLLTGLLLAVSKEEQLAAECHDDKCPSSSKDIVTAYHAGRIMAFAGGGVALVGAVVGSVLLLTADPDPIPQRQTARIELLFGAGQVALKGAM